MTEIILHNENPTDYNNLLLNIIIEKKHSKHIKNIKNNTFIKQYDSTVDIDIDIKCNDCMSRNLVELNGYYVCQKCGLYNDCIIDAGQEWRFYGSEDSKGNDQSRCDIPTNDLLPKTSIGSLVGFSTRENKTSKRIRNMNYWNAIPYRESSLLESFNNITIMSQNSGINHCIIEEAKYMYKKVTDIKSSRRTKKEAMKAGCIMLACKLKGVPRNCSEIAQIFKLKNNKTFRKSIKAFEEIWNNIQNRSLEKQDLEKQSTNSSNDSNDDSNDSSNDSNDDSNDDSNSDDEENYNDKGNHKYDSRDNLIKTTSLKKLDIKKNEHENEKEINKSDAQKIDDTIFQLNCINKIGKLSDISDINKDTTLKLLPNKNSSNTITSKNLQECITKLHRFSCILGFDDKIFEACRIILIHIENEKYLDKHTPLSRTSAVIYYIIDRLCIKNINKHQILKTCEVSDVTINKCYQKLMKYKKELLNINI
jgi:transcription initiation factor TFIIIB Brf1 subunit/transcription initiation factor TFIIB